MQTKESEKQIGARDRRFVVWSRARALAEKTRQTFDDVLPEAMTGIKLSGTDLRGVLDLEKVNQEIWQTVLGSPPAPEVPAAPPEPSADAGSADDIFTIFGGVDEPASDPGVEDDVSADDVDQETRLLGARGRVIAHLNKVRVLPCHAIPFPKLGVSFFMVGKITVDGDHREWNHTGKNAKFKALIPDCETKIVVLNGETYPKPFFFEDWAWQPSAKEKQALCSGNLKVFCLKHEPGTEYICWVNPGGKGDPWRFIYKMTDKGLELTRYRLKPESRDDYVRLDAKPVIIGPIE